MSCNCAAFEGKLEAILQLLQGLEGRISELEKKDKKFLDRVIESIKDQRSWVALGSISVGGMQLKKAVSVSKEALPFVDDFKRIEPMRRAIEPMKRQIDIAKTSADVAKTTATTASATATGAAVATAKLTAEVGSIAATLASIAVTFVLANELRRAINNARSERERGEKLLLNLILRNHEIALGRSSANAEKIEKVEGNLSLAYAQGDAELSRRIHNNLSDINKNKNSIQYNREIIDSNSKIISITRESTKKNRVSIDFLSPKVGGNTSAISQLKESDRKQNQRITDVGTMNNAQYTNLLKQLQNPATNTVTKIERVPVPTPYPVTNTVTNTVTKIERVPVPTPYPVPQIQKVPVPAPYPVTNTITKIEKIPIPAIDFTSVNQKLTSLKKDTSSIKKNTTKTEKTTRQIPFIIPQLQTQIQRINPPTKADICQIMKVCAPQPSGGSGDCPEIEFPPEPIVFGEWALAPCSEQQSIQPFTFTGQGIEGIAEGINQLGETLAAIYESFCPWLKPMQQEWHYFDCKKLEENPEYQGIEYKVGIDAPLFGADFFNEFLKQKIEMDLEAHKSFCTIDAIAAIPDHWQVRIGADRPQLVILYAESLDNGGVGSTRYQQSIPHWNGLKNWDLLPRWQKGNYQSRSVLSDNSRIIFYANSEVEAEKVLQRFLLFVKPEYKKNYQSYVGETNNDIKKIQIVPCTAKYYARGQETEIPIHYQIRNRK